MSGFHNTPEGPKRCKASKRPCKYAEAGQPHFKSQEEAAAAYAKHLQGEHGAVATMKRLSAEAGSGTGAAQAQEETSYRRFIAEQQVQDKGGCSSTALSPQVEERLAADGAFRSHVVKQLESAGLAHLEGTRLQTYGTREQVLSGLRGPLLDAYGEEMAAEVIQELPSTSEASILSMLKSERQEVQEAAHASLRRYAEDRLERLSTPVALNDYGSRFASVETPDGPFVMGVEATGEAGDARSHLQRLGS